MTEKQRFYTESQFYKIKVIKFDSRRHLSYLHLHTLHVWPTIIHRKLLPLRPRSLFQPYKNLCFRRYVSPASGSFGFESSFPKSKNTTSPILGGKALFTESSGSNSTALIGAVPIRYVAAPRHHYSTHRQVERVS